MNRYIKFEDAVKVMACEMYAEAQSQGYEVDSIEDFIPEAKAWMNDAPSADRPQGEWIVHKERTEVNDGFIDFFPTEYECSNCGLKQSMYFINSKPSNFCPNCGVDMR